MDGDAIGDSPGKGQRPRVLVLTTVHHADDVRISRKLIPALAGGFEVAYTSRLPRPTAIPGDVTWSGLGGGRIRRWWGAARRAWFGRWDLLVLHDPETLPIGWVARLRGPVVFDLHERFPDQLAHKPWMPAMLRGPAKVAAGLILRMSERLLTVTLAEEGYRELLRGDAPVFANLPRDLPTGEVGGRSGVVYVGDVTEARGVPDLVIAAGRAGQPLTVVGPMGPEMRRRLEDAARAAGTDLTLTGRLPHDEAMARVAAAAVAASPLRDLPNYRWSPPTKLYEYLIVGTPVVATDLPATRAVAGAVPTVRLVPPGDVDALSAALAEVMSDPTLIVRAVADAPAYAQRWSWNDRAVLDFHRGLVRR